MKLTEKGYINAEETCCPVCGGTDVEGRSFDVIDNEAFQEMYCRNCDSSWQDVYTLTGIARLHDNMKNADLD